MVCISRATFYAVIFLGVLVLVSPLKLSGEERVIEIIADKDARYKVPGQRKPVIVARPGEILQLRITARRGPAWQKNWPRASTYLSGPQRSRLGLPHARGYSRVHRCRPQNTWEVRGPLHGVLRPGPRRHADETHCARKFELRSCRPHGLTGAQL